MKQIRLCARAVGLSATHVNLTLERGVRLLLQLLSAESQPMATAIQWVCVQRQNTFEPHLAFTLHVHQRNLMSARHPQMD